VTGPLEVGGLRIEAIETPGHADDHLAFLVGDALFSGDVLFKDAVGGGDPDQVRDSVMRLMDLPKETRVYPGHTDETTIGREWEENPFVRVWRGVDPEGDERCSVGGREGVIAVWSPDYDGKGKAWVRFDDGTGRILGASRIERT
jgi:glyoxylase-like metal-dependent hydrolase (beta-lactamase superfamily II)